jgi:hypothetical protein
MTITLEPKLQNKLDQTAQRLGKSPEEIASEAIRTHLEELDTQALDHEERAYQQLYPELRKQYSQQYVAIYEGRLVDSDSNFEELFLRIQKNLGDQAVLIRQVNDSPVEEYHFRSPRLEQNS